MSILFHQVRQLKSCLYEVARGVLRSRERLAEKNLEQDLEIKRLNEKNKQLIARNKHWQQRLIETEYESKMLRCENEQLLQQPIQLPNDLPLPHHCFGPKMIALCLNLCKVIGFRSTEVVLKIIFEWLRIETHLHRAGFPA